MICWEVLEKSIFDSPIFISLKKEQNMATDNKIEALKGIWRVRLGFRAGYLNFKLKMNVVVQTFEPSLQNFTKNYNFGRRNFWYLF